VKQGGKYKTWKRRFFLLDTRRRLLKYFAQAKVFGENWAFSDCPVFNWTLRFSPQDMRAKGVIKLDGYQVSSGDLVLQRENSIIMEQDGMRCDSSVYETIERQA